ncbi:hypothetical protein GCM10012288_19860 [Malaciobacter pacificus]|jgi:ABC-type uncharacterized transport system substrate-binding protein|uniref:ABC transporter, periplasmic substrate-binding protein (DUF1007 domain) n=1 Tax=Malaciobacter pacificus TaxID=1080223 RepID=A0A5C2H8P9_9BACT|nr:DUF1007 family protein [Malaciobacter pacificus]QEP33596.1 ABC transporter, periplasmic substrate-binding protein (DUF1007 domain) [Malaciobacter pacificus]GGD45550.1 hypothetical protein GCM10012288_19860 [Malaciobacter pacificus]
MKKLSLFIFLTISLYAHPHYFLDSSLEVSNENIKNIWKFDRLNSKILMFDFDKNKNKILDEEEKIEFLNSHFFKLKQNNYNIFLANEETEFNIEPKNVDLVFDKKRLSIVFDIPFHLSSDTTICTMDEKIMLAYKLDKLNTNYKTDIQKSEYDYCIGVLK